MIKIISLLFIALFFTNCSTKKLSPANVTNYFWSAQQEAELEDAKKFVRQKDQKYIALQKNIKIKRFTFKDVIQDGDTATVPTKLYLEGIFSKAQKDQVEIDFDTRLEKTDDGWKVNLTETKKALYLETTKKFSKGIGANILKIVQDRMGDFRDIQGIMEEMVDSMKKTLEKN